MQRVLFIYTRHAGKNKTWASLSDIINAMTEQDCLVTTYPTQYRGDAGEAIVRWSGDAHWGMLFVALCVGYMLWASFKLKIKQ